MVICTRSWVPRVRSIPVAGRLGAQHGVTARGTRSSSGGLGRRGGGTGGEKGLWNAYPSSQDASYIIGVEINVDGGVGQI
jgi:hypothetical protein